MSSSACAVELTPKLLQQICRSLGLYQTAELNDKLYLHYKGLTHIAYLQPYTGLRVLYLEGNALTSLHGLEAQQELRCLYVQENSLEALDSLCSLPQLSTLNAATNFISALPDAAATGWSLPARLPRLHSLTLTSNRIASVQSLEAMRDHPELAVLDLQHNRLGASTVQASEQQTQQGQAEAEAEFASLLGLLQSLPQLRVLYLLGNPLIAQLANYRRRTLAALPQLTYLDERPVFDEERRMVAAWHKGGLDEERHEKGRMRSEERDKERRQWELFDKLVSQAATDKDEKEHDQLASAANQQQQLQQPQPQPASQQTTASSSSSTRGPSGWEEKEQLAEPVDEEMTLSHEQRVGQASNRQSAMRAWQSTTSQADGKQSQYMSAANLELGARGRVAAPRQGGMLIEVIEEAIDA